MSKAISNICSSRLIDAHNIWTSDYPSTLGGLSLGVIEVGQAGTATTAFLNESVLMNETLCNKPHPSSKQTCTVKACLHLLIISADALLCISISYTQILCFARKENITGQSRSQPKWPAGTSLLATPCMHAWVRLRKHRCRCSYHRLPQIISHQVRHNLRCAQL